MLLTHPVTDDWRKLVRKELDAGGRGAQARLVEYINKHGVKCSSGQLADILDGKYQTSDVVELVHEYFKWPPPLAPSASIDAGELAHVGARMTKEQRDLMARLAGVLEGKTGDEARQMLETMLAGLESRKPPTK